MLNKLSNIYDFIFPEWLFNVKRLWRNFKSLISLWTVANSANVQVRCSVILPIILLHHSQCPIILGRDWRHASTLMMKFLLIIVVAGRDCWLCFPHWMTLNDPKGEGRGGLGETSSCSGNIEVMFVFREALIASYDLGALSQANVSRHHWVAQKMKYKSLNQSSSYKHKLEILQTSTSTYN